MPSRRTVVSSSKCSSEYRISVSYGISSVLVKTYDVGGVSATAVTDDAGAVDAAAVADVATDSVTTAVVSAETVSAAVEVVSGGKAILVTAECTVFPVVISGDTVVVSAAGGVADVSAAALTSIVSSEEQAQRSISAQNNARIKSTVISRLSDGNDFMRVFLLPYPVRDEFLL